MTEDKSKADAADQEHWTPHRAMVICAALLVIAAVLSGRPCTGGRKCCDLGITSWCYGRCAYRC